MKARLKRELAEVLSGNDPLKAIIQVTSGLAAGLALSLGTSFSVLYKLVM